MTSDLITFGVCVNQNNFTHEFIEKSKVFTISILSEDAPMNLIGNFGFNSGRDINKFKNLSGDWVYTTYSMPKDDFKQEE